MAIPTTDELIRLLIDPRESLIIEHKGWLDLSQNGHKANLAKAAIALANEGGGIIVLGTREDTSQGGQLGSYARPGSRYSLDDINSAIGRYADPQFHCELAFAQHPETQVEHAFVIVPGGMTVPVMSHRDSDGEIQAQRCYVRKPGPKSEEPYTAEEWRGVIERCLQARRESMLDAIRAIVQGHVEPTAMPPTAKAKLLEFIRDSQDRWQDLIAPLPSDDPARMPYGHYEIAFSVIGTEQTPNRTELLRHIANASIVHHTGWPPFVHLHRQPYEPRPIGDTIETWLGNPDGERPFGRASVLSDYWRVHKERMFFLLRGYDEDSMGERVPGTTFELSLPIWRVGETMLFAARIAKQFGDELEVLTICHYTGLRNRYLMSRNDPFIGIKGERCDDDTVTLEIQTTVPQIEDNLVEVLHQLLSPLYEQFSFFRLRTNLVAEEVERLRSTRL
ncbi:MAG: hypothetical protein IT320_07610 [Anaerolineae bacterium]|nr:hypothetical protein [Anaerolineae bacterium]